MKTYRHLLVATALVAAFTFSITAFRTPDTQPKEMEYLYMTTIESIIPMGLGRSRLFITHPDGSVEEEKLKNLYSGTGINLGNVNQNDRLVQTRVMELTAEGWDLQHITSGTQSPSQGVSQGIFLTRYIFKREQ